MSKLFLYDKVPYVLATRQDVAMAERTQYTAMLHKLRHIMPAWLLRMLDKIGRRWLTKNNSPYGAEIAALAAVHATGIYTINTLFEWCCTTYVFPNADTQQPQMRRVLDWALPIGEFVHTANYDTPHGSYTDINWAGNAGVINAVAPGRFAIAINQAPVDARSGIMLLDWLLQRYHTWRSTALPPSHLLRKVFEEAPDYDTAHAMLCDTPLCIPAIFTICGPHPGAAAVIERRERAAYVMTGTHVATANHWQNPAWRGHARTIRSRRRLKLAQQQLQNPHGATDWLCQPIINKHTALAFTADANRLCSLQIMQK